ncbi:MAG: RnfABCDGE type electron transport complex subunit D [Candidatus Krumholzibacteriota bacterium]|nr:RnfABCDGE type electron transport complex subunit D [Candidatus Krumholzibacteriota bacterium]
MVSASPHVHDGRTVAGIMKLVVLALAPATLFSFYIFGLAAVRVVGVSILSAVVFEALFQRIAGRPVRIGDWSAVLTGLLLALNLPATAPWWLVVVGAFFAIVIAKQLYGGLGYNPFNPALVGRVVLLLSFPVQMTAGWVAPSRWGMDAVTTATPLTRLREALLETGSVEGFAMTRDQVLDLVIGNRAGCLGETSVILLLIGGVFLIAKKVISWHIPVAFIASVWIFAGIAHLADPSRFVDASFHVITGGLFIGALYMATDYVTSPLAKRGMLIFGAGCGIITMVIRLFGAYPEGVSFAILLMNAATPLIDRYTKPTVFGAVKRAAAS